MGWVRIDDQFPDHPKVLEAGPAAGWLYVCGLAYANRFRTDGFIPDSALRVIRGTKRTADALVRAGLWERVEGGYQIHDYLDYQPSKAEMERERQQTAERVRRWRKRNGDVTPLLDRITDDGRNAGVTVPPTQPNPELTHTGDTAHAHAREAGQPPAGYAWIRGYAERWGPPSSIAQERIAALVRQGVALDLVEAAMEDAASFGADAPDAWMAKKLATWFGYGLRTATDLAAWKADKQARGRDSPRRQRGLSAADLAAMAREQEIQERAAAGSERGP